MTAIVFSEATLTNDVSSDMSKDTSDEDDAVFHSIKPLEAAIMPVRSLHIVINRVTLQTCLPCL